MNANELIHTVPDSQKAQKIIDMSFCPSGAVKIAMKTQTKKTFTTERASMKTFILQLVKDHTHERVQFENRQPHHIRFPSKVNLTVVHIQNTEKICR